MELKKRDYLITFTVLGLAAFLFMAYQYLGTVVYSLTETWIMNQEAGIFCRLSWLFESPWTDTLVQYLFVLGGAYPLVWIMVCRIPKVTGGAVRMSLEDFILCLAAAMGIGYIFNFLGTAVNLFFSQFNGKSVFEMNPVADTVLDPSPSMILYSCFLGPFMEELMFRGIFLKRARRFGDRTAVIFTAVLFGLMHGNLLQFFYAAAIGLVLGAAAVKTNGIRHTVLMHVMINSYGMILVAGENLLISAGAGLPLILYSFAFLCSICFLIVGAVVILWKYGPAWYRQLTENNGERSPYRKYVYGNPGFLLFLGVCLMEMAVYIF